MSLFARWEPATGAAPRAPRSSLFIVSRLPFVRIASPLLPSDGGLFDRPPGLLPLSLGRPPAVWPPDKVVEALRLDLMVEPQPR